jgi:hypothetical protein
VIGVYRGKDLHYAATVRAGFVPLTRCQVFERIKPLEMAECPFVNLPEKDAGRWGQGLTAEKMKECVWIRPKVVAEVEFLEWTGADHLRHTKFVSLRDDKGRAAWSEDQLHCQLQLACIVWEDQLWLVELGISRVEEVRRAPACVTERVDLAQVSGNVLRMVENVDRLRLKLEGIALGKVDALYYRCVPVVDRPYGNGIATGVRVHTLCSRDVLGVRIVGSIANQIGGALGNCSTRIIGPTQPCAAGIIDAADA